METQLQILWLPVLAIIGAIFALVLWKVFKFTLKKVAGILQLLIGLYLAIAVIASYLGAINLLGDVAGTPQGIVFAILLVAIALIIGGIGLML